MNFAIRIRAFNFYFIVPNEGFEFPRVNLFYKRKDNRDIESKSKRTRPYILHTVNFV